MQFVKLRLAGFKSFVDPTELWIQPGLTGIVGPNGCGKSNLIEALQWMMGETSARKLRGVDMDDVIFTGTEARPARNIAEVTLSIDNAARKATAAFNGSDEIEVTRRIERNSGSSYRVNGREVRQRDVQLLFADAATGARSPALVSQGQVDAVINAKPQERRALLEEAAGTAGLHARRHEAELRLRGAEANLTRLDDLIAQQEIQLQALQRQAKQAGRYRRLGEHIRRAEAILLHLKWTEAAASLQGARAELAAAEATVVGATETAAVAATQQAETAAILPALRQEEVAAAAELQRLRHDLARLDDEDRRIAGEEAAERARETQASDDIARETARLADAETALERLEAEEAEIAAAQEGEGALLAAAEGGVRAAAAEVAAREARLSALNGEIAAVEARRQALIAQLEEARTRISRLAARAASLESRRTELGALAVAEEDLARSQHRLAEAETRLQAREAEAVAAQQARDERLAEETAVRDRFQLAQSAHARLAAEEAAIAHMLAGGARGDWPPVIDQIAVAAGYEVALGAALGDDLVAALAEEAPVRWRTAEDHASGPALPEGAAALSEFVQAPAALRRRLEQIGVVADAATARQAWAMLAQGQRLVTRDGGVWRWDGFSVQPGTPIAAANRLTQRNRLQRVRADLEPAKAALADAEADLAHALTAATAAADTVRRAQEAVRASYAGTNATREARAALRQRAEGHGVQMAALVQAEREVEADYNAAEEDRRRLEAAQAELPDLSARREEAEQLHDDLADRRAQLIDAQGALSRLIEESRARGQRCERLASDRNSWRNRADDASRQLRDLGARLDEIRHRLAQLANAPAEIAARRAALSELAEAAEKKRQASADRLAEAERLLAEADRALKSAEASLAAAREERIRREAGVAQGEQTANVVAERIAERLECAPEAALAAVEVEEHEELPPLAQIEERFHRLVRERDGMGPVNLRAEVEAEELDAQLTTQRAERDDLVAAIAKLRDGIASLNREGRERLYAAFEQVQQHFQELFVRLFGGGRAEMKLVEAEDPLDTGIEIYASPPGKRLQHLSLLSGGEKALTALSLLFAVFLTNPAPVCVLDEVDAPLDEANIDRLCTLLEEMANKLSTRYLIITHQSMTMARVHRLFGVTMAERGVSQLVSVDLQQAERIRATA